MNAFNQIKRGKYPDVILPMSVLRRLDAVLEPTKKAVLETKEMLDKAGITSNTQRYAMPPSKPFTTPRSSRSGI